MDNLMVVKLVLMLAVAMVYLVVGELVVTKVE